MIESLDKLAFDRKNNSLSILNKNNNNNKINRFSISRNNVKYIKKSGKLFKLRK